MDESTVEILEDLIRGLKTIEDRLEKIENRISDLEINESFVPGDLSPPADYDYVEYPEPTKWNYRTIQSPAEQKCLFDQLSEEDRKKPMLISCPCPKCTPRC